MKRAVGFVIMVPVVGIMLFICAGMALVIPLGLLGISPSSDLGLAATAIVALGMFGWMRSKS